MQSMVDDAYEGFVDVIAEGRGMSENDVKKLLTDEFMTAARRNRIISLMNSATMKMRSKR